MKNLYFLVFLLITTLVTAQKTGIGLKAGSHVSNYRGLFDDLFTGRIGYHFSLYGEIPIGNKLSIQPEIGYASLGARLIIKADEIEGSHAFSGTDIEALRDNHLTVPLVLRYKMGRVFSVTAGPQFNFHLNSVVKIVQEFDESPYEPPTDELRTSGEFGYTFNFSLGIGFELNTKARLELRYVHAFKDHVELAPDFYRPNMVASLLSFSYQLFEF